MVEHHPTRQRFATAFLTSAQGCFLTLGPPLRDHPSLGRASAGEATLTREPMQ
jgi:hypothetical protein